MSSNTRKISTEAREFSLKLDDFVKMSKQHILNIRTEAENYRTKELETLTGFSARINQQLEKLQEDLKTIHSKEEASDEAMGAIRRAVEETQEGMKSAFTSWSENLRLHCETTCKEAETSTAASCVTVRRHSTNYITGSLTCFRWRKPSSH